MACLNTFSTKKHLCIVVIKRRDDRIRETVYAQLVSRVEWTSCTVIQTVSYGPTRSRTVVYDRLHDHPRQFDYHGFNVYTRMARV